MAAIETFENMAKLKRSLTLIFGWKYISLLPLATFALSQVQQSLTLVSVRQEFLYGIDLILPAALGPGVYSASNRNEYQELKKK
jgi:uncharacterized membrane protein (DUF485 family)